MISDVEVGGVDPGRRTLAGSFRTSTTKSNTFSAGAEMSRTCWITCDPSETEPQLLRMNLSPCEKPASCGGLRFAKR
jgi:hypothetical protein